MTGDPWRRLFAQARRRGFPWESVPPQDGDSLSPRRLAAPWPALPSRLHVAVSPAWVARPRGAGCTLAPRSCAPGWNSACSFPVEARQQEQGQEREPLLQGSVAPLSEVPLAPERRSLWLQKGSCFLIRFQLLDWVGMWSFSFG